MADVVGANQLVESQLTDHLMDIETETSSDCLTYVGAITHGTDDLIRVAIEALKGRSTRRRPRLRTHNQ